LQKARADPKKLDWLKCPTCLGATVLYRQKTYDYVCRRCGRVFRVSWLDKKTYPVQEKRRLK